MERKRDVPLAETVRYDKVRMVQGSGAESSCCANGGEMEALGTICMYTHDGSGRKAILTGWLASQSDMLSEDWEIVGQA